MARKIYLASSWRNTQQEEVLMALRGEGYEVYDFKNPAWGQSGFSWAQIDRQWMGWDPVKFAELVTTDPIAADGFSFDKAALDWCDTCVLLLPSGRSAHLEAGYAAGQGKQVVVMLHRDGFEPELMYLLADAIVCKLPDLLWFLQFNTPKCKFVE
jgi:hypothetical protein